MNNHNNKNNNYYSNDCDNYDIDNDTDIQMKQN